MKKPNLQTHIFTLKFPVVLEETDPDHIDTTTLIAAAESLLKLAKRKPYKFHDEFDFVETHCDQN